MSPVLLHRNSVALPDLFICFVVSIGLIRICCDATPSAMSPLCNTDIPSRTARAVIVIEGRTRRVETSPSWIARTSASGGGGPLDNDYFNITVKPRTVYKGDLPKDERNGYLPIAIGEFAPDEDWVNCIPSVRLGSRYLFFLNGTGVLNSSYRLTPFYRLAGFPAPVSNETVSLAREYSCSTCSEY